jgi:hypothetical protein
MAESQLVKRWRYGHPRLKALPALPRRVHLGPGRLSSNEQTHRSDRRMGSLPRRNSILRVGRFRAPKENSLGRERIPGLLIVHRV